jgi:hypothetical protein
MLTQVTASRQVRGGALFLHRLRFNTDVASYVAAQCPHLQRISIWGWSAGVGRRIAQWLPWLTQVDLHGARREDLLALAEGCGELRVLRLVRAAHSGMPELALGCRALHEYHLQIVTGVEVRDDDVVALALNCPLLRRVELTEETPMAPQLLTDRGLLALVAHCVHLDVMTLPHCAITAAGVAEATRIAQARGHSCCISITPPAVHHPP